MTAPRKPRSQSITAGVAILGISALLATGCANANTEAAAGGSGASGGTDGVDQFLYAPDDSERVAPDPQLVTNPDTGAPILLPYFNALPVADGPIGDANKTYKICFSQALIRHPFAEAMRASLAAEAARHPNIEILYYNTDNDPLKQIQDLETCAAQKPDAILVWPHSTAPLTPTIEKLNKDGFLVVGMERSVATREYDHWIYLDGKAQTAALAEFAGELLGGKGVIAETGGDVGASATIIRRDGFAEALGAEYPDITINTTPHTDFSAAQGYQVALQFLGSPQGQDIDAWYVHSGTTAFGVQRAMEQLGRTDIPIFTIDGSEPEIQAVIDGRFAAVMPNAPVHADVALRLAIQEINGEKPAKDVLLGVTDLITEDNAQDWLEGAWGAGSQDPS
ncbi:sugar ABC transporter substrate-binding protein [Modestobacter lapidis]|nr:sugar ABC transporter substrate-binding protein [Modestobacter lapidis]